MKTLPILLLLTAASAPATLAQSTATVKTKVKPNDAPNVKTKTEVVVPDAEAAAEARQEAFDAKIAEKANALTANMQQNLGLRGPQLDRVREINLRGVEGVERARRQHLRDPRKMASVIDDISATRMSLLKDVLTPQQFDKYQRKREEKMGIPNAQGNQGTLPPGLGGGQ